MDDHNYSQPSDHVPGEHIRALSEICRLCHAFLKKNAKGYSVETYETEIERVYHLDLAFEKRQSETFPRKICDTCYFRMHKARQNFENGKDYKPSMTKAAVFKPHHCWAKGKYQYVHTHIYINEYIMFQICSVEHSYGLDGESLRDFHYLNLFIAHCSQFEHSGDSTMQSYN